MATLGRRRALGQHFLKDKAAAQFIADETLSQARHFGCVSLLEIGPGRGAITEPILEGLDKALDVKEVILSERDTAIAEHWRSRSGRVRVEVGDFLELPEEKWLLHAPLAVVSNLPYSAGTAILTRLARHRDAIPFMVLMFQAEVALRLRAEESTKSRGSLSVWIQNRWDVRKLRAVPPGAFAPPPEVDSEVVLLTRRSHPRIAVPETPRAEAQWEALLKAAFAHRRKMLRSGLPPGPFRNALELSGVDGTKRSEALNWDEWRALHHALMRVEGDIG